MQPEPVFTDPNFAEFLRLPALTLSTKGIDGEPHAAVVYFAAGEGMDLYFFSASDSQHVQDVQADPRAAAALFPQSQGWQDIRGLQMRGLVKAVERGQEWDLAWAQYRRKFPFVTGLKAIVARNALFAFTPHWVRLVDNRRSFGYKEEWTIP